MWRRWFVFLRCSGVSIFRERPATKAWLFFKYALTPKAQSRQEREKSMENCLPIVLWPKWSQISAGLLWLESCGCHRSHFFLPACPFYLPSQSRWVALAGLYTRHGGLMPAAESAPAGYTQALVKLANTQLRSAADLGSMRDLKEKQSADQFLTLPFREWTLSGAWTFSASSQETPSLTK